MEGTIGGIAGVAEPGDGVKGTLPLLMFGMGDVGATGDVGVAGIVGMGGIILPGTSPTGLPTPGLVKVWEEGERVAGEVGAVGGETLTTAAGLLSVLT